MRRFLRASLAAHGFRVVEAGDGARGACALATSHNPDARPARPRACPTATASTLTRALREWSRDADHRDLRARPRGRQGRGARRRRRRLPDQAVRRERAARAHARRAAPRARRARPPSHRRSSSARCASTSRAARSRARTRGAPHPDRVPAARAARAERRQGADPPPDPEAGLGAKPGRAHPLRARAHGRAAQEDRGRPRAPEADRDRAGRRLPAARRV